MAAHALTIPEPWLLGPSVVIGGRRQQIESVIDWLMGLLDASDGDPDLEPSLGASEAYDVGPTNWTGHLGKIGARDECEPDHDDEPESVEPNFASTMREDAIGIYAPTFHDEADKSARESRGGGFTADDPYPDDSEMDDNGLADDAGMCEQMGSRCAGVTYAFHTA